MTRSKHALAGLTVAALLLTACSGTTDEGQDGGDSTANAVNVDVEGEPDAYHEAVGALGDRYPEMEWNQKLPKDVTEEQLQTYLDDGRLPPGEAHGGYFETMTNAVAAKEEAPDVMFFGDSMTQQGIDPKVVGDELSESTGEDVTAFNAASSRARWGINKMVATYLVKVDKVPDVAVLMISTRAAEGDSFYEEDVAHTSFSSVVEGCERERGKNWTAEDETQCRENVEDLTERYRESGGQVARAEQGKMPVTSGRVDEDSVLRSDGMMIHPSMTKKEVRQSSDKRMERGFPGIPTVVDQAVSDFGETARILEENGATVIASEIPYSPTHQKNLDEAYDGYDTKRMEAAEELTRRGDVPLYPVGSYGSWWGDHDSRDEIHLAPQGAASFSRQLLNSTPGFGDAVEEGLED